MADLFVNRIELDGNRPRLAARLNLYCQDHERVHEVTVEDVERLVYALLAAEVEAYRLGFADSEETSTVNEGYTQIDCPFVALQRSTSSEGFLEHVEASIASRIAS